MGLLIASTVRLAPQGLLSFRYTDGLARRISTRDDWEADKNNVPAGMNPAAIAARVTVLLPFDCSGWFRCDVEDHSVHALDLVDDPVADPRQHLVRHARPVGGHGVLAGHHAHRDHVGIGSVVAHH